MATENITLVEPSDDLKEELVAMAEEYRLAGDDQYQEALDNFSKYLARLRRFARGEDLPGHIVQESMFLLLRDARIVGRIKLRHHLNESLEIEGGHIGYDVRPSERGKGYATTMLRLTLDKARQIGLKRVMLTCDDDNIASSKVIEKNGGELTGTAVSPRTGKPIRQYWIEL